MLASLVHTININVSKSRLQVRWQRLPIGQGILTAQMQVVADNFDTQISSQNGLKSTHGLAMIVTHAGQANSEESESEVQKIKRLKWEETDQINYHFSN